MNFITSFFTIWTQPRATIRYARDHYPLASVFWVCAGLTVLGILFSLDSEPKLTSTMACVVLAMTVLLTFLGIWGLKKIAGWLGSEATFRDVFYSVYVNLFMAPLIWAAEAFSSFLKFLNTNAFAEDKLVFSWLIIGYAVLVAAIVWAVVVYCLSLGELLKFKKGSPAWRAFFSSLILILIMIAMIVIAGLVAFSVSDITTALSSDLLLQ